MPRHDGHRWFFPNDDDDWEERAELYAALERALHTEWRDGEHLGLEQADEATAEGSDLGEPTGEDDK